MIKEGKTLRIDDWLSSCRVFSRTLEHFMFNQVLKLAPTLGVECIIGEFVPTERNSVFKNLYPQLGFQSDDKTGQWWRFEISDQNKMQKSYVTEEGDPGNEYPQQNL
ncbi:hypothetical protein [Magnetovibrio blakemorei]|nr:hypothetical protein [Magnetovibrio blakemorei]